MSCFREPILKKPIIVLAFIGTICMLHADPVQPVRGWSLIFGDFNNQRNGFDSWPMGVSVDFLDNLYVVGTTLDSFDGQPMHTKANEFPYIVKVSAAGHKLWTRTWGAGDFETVRAADCAVDRDNSIFVTGSATWPVDDDTAPSFVDPAFVTKFDAAGNKLWTRIWGFDENSTSASSRGWAYGCGVDSSGCVLSVGRTLYQFDGQSNPSLQSDFSACMVKYSMDGDKLWTRIWGSVESDEAYDVACDSTNSIYVVGLTTGSIDGEPVVGGYGEDIFMTKFDTNGNKLWTRIWGSTYFDAARKVFVDGKDSIYVVGLTEGAFDGQYNLYADRFFLSKFDNNGNCLWSRIWGDCDVIVAGVLVDPFGNIFVTGRQFVPNVGDTSQPYLAMFDSQGQLVFERMWASPYASRVDSGGMGVDSHGDVYVASYTTSGFDGYSMPGTSFVTKWLVSDSDSDGLADHWERETYGNLSYSGGDDSDEDGWTAREEYTAGTSDNDSSSYLSVQSILATTNNMSVVSWQGNVGRKYSLLLRTNLQYGAWIPDPAYNSVAGTQGTMSHTNTRSADSRYYRIGVRIDED